MDPNGNSTEVKSDDYSLAVHHGQCDQKSRTTPQPHLPQVSLDSGIFHGWRTFVWHQGQ
jgi:hypothetical protein